VKHIMIECVDLHDVRNKHFVVSSMKDLFENVASQNISSLAQDRESSPAKTSILTIMLRRQKKPF